MLDKKLGMVLQNRTEYRISNKRIYDIGVNETSTTLCRSCSQYYTPPAKLVLVLVLDKVEKHHVACIPSFILDAAFETLQ
jgi:hypothetical protein